MKYVKQFLIILVISFIGEIVHYFIDLPIPASIYGMVLLFILLELKIIHVDEIRETAVFLVAVMPLMFIPAGVGLMEKWGLISDIWLPLIATIIISTVVVMAVTGLVTQFVISKKKGTNDLEDIFDEEDLQ